MFKFSYSIPLIHKPLGEEVVRKHKMEDAKKDMKESGYMMTVAFVMLCTVWLIRKFILKK